MKKICFLLLTVFSMAASFAQSDDLVFIRVNVNSGSSFYNTDIYFNDNATAGFNFGFDAQFFGAIPAFSVYSYLAEDNIGEAYAIQAVNTSDLANIVIPLGINANQGQSVTVQIGTSTLPATTEVFFDDLLAGTSTQLTTSNYVFTPSTTITGEGRFYLRISDPTFPITYTYDGSWSPSDPSGLTTGIDNLEVISGDATLSSTTTVNSISIEPGTSLTIENGDLTATSMNLKSNSTSYSSLIHQSSNTINGVISYERFVNSNAGGNDLVASPVMNQDWLSFLNDNDVALLNDGNFEPTTYAFAPFDKTTGDFENLNSNSSYTIPTGIGHRVATNLGETLIFTGDYPTGTAPSENTIAVDIRNSGPDFAEWNLIGNPYPSYIDISNFFFHELSGGLTNIQLLTPVRAGIYAYNGNNYDVINLANVSATPKMTPGQGFFVSANASFIDSHDLEFTVAMQTTGNNDDFIAGRNQELIMMTLNFTTESSSTKTEIYCNDNSSNGFDIGYDAAIYEDIIPEFSIYSHLVQQNNGIPIALQTMQYEELLNQSIPLGVHAIVGEEITFSLGQYSLPESANIYLDDVVANTVTLLNDSDYSITPMTALQGTGRFFLRVSENALSTSEEVLPFINIYTPTNSYELVISGQLLENSLFKLFDAMGKNVLSADLDASQLENRIDTSSLASGIYILKIENNKQLISKKVIIN